MATNKILAIVCVLQFAIISVWLSRPVDPRHISPAPAPAGTPAAIDPTPPAPVSPHPAEPLPRSLDIPPSRPAPLEGVAAVVMLHSPKWFQRRYTMMLQNVCNNMLPGWAVQVFYINEGGSRTGLHINPGIERLVRAGKVVLTEIPRRVWYKKKRRSDYFLDPWLWENMLAEKVLLFGGGTVLCSNSLLTVRNFTSFDYVGSPWSAFRGRGGSGEISMRTRSVMLDAIHTQLGKANITEGFTDAWGLEDQFFVRSIIDFIDAGRPLKLASREDSKMFAASNGHHTLEVFSASGTLSGLSDKERSEFFDYCPEIKVIFPSLHNPGCFGANLQRDQCARSICALNPQKKSC